MDFIPEPPDPSEKPDPAELVERIRERKRLTKSTLTADQILKHQKQGRA
jgi:hypothetical protein